MRKATTAFFSMALLALSLIAAAEHDALPTLDRTGQLILFEGDVRDVVTIETTVEHRAFATHHVVTYVDLSLTGEESGNKLVRLQCDRCRDLDQGAHVLVAAELASGKSGFDNETTQLSVLSIHEE